MVTYQYTDRKVKYYCILALAGACILRVTGVSLIFAIFAALLLLAAFIVFRHRVVFTQDKVIFTNIFPKKFEFEKIEAISMNEDYLSFMIQYSNFGGITHRVGEVESDKDQAVFRQILGELIGRAKERNPKIEVSSSASEFLDPESDLSVSFSTRIASVKGTFKGIKGWLLCLAVFLIASCYFDASLIPALSGYQGLGLFVTFAGWILRVSLVLFDLIVLMFLFMRKRSFKKAFISLLFYNIVSQIVVTALNFCVNGDWFRLPNTLLFIALYCIYNIAWLFAWKAYLTISIRVKNTFGV